MGSIHRSTLAAILAIAAFGSVFLTQFNQESEVSLNGISRVLEEVDRDEPVNIEASISGISPAYGPFAGGNEVIITGTALLAKNGLEDVRQVIVGGVAVRQVTSASPTELKVVLGHRNTQQHSPGPADVHIVSRTKGRTDAPGLYHFHTPPRILKLRPDNGPHEGHNEVLIEGKHLTAGIQDHVRVLVDSEPCKVLASTKHSVRVIMPDRKQHTRRHTADIEVLSAAFGRSTLSQSYTYSAAPTITHLSPSEGPAGGGNTLRIHGDQLTAGEDRTDETVQVTVGGQAAELLSFSPSEVLVRVPAGKGLSTVVVSSSRHGRTTKARAYKYHAAPRVDSVTPSMGPADGGSHVVIRGRHLSKGDVKHVYFGFQKAHVLHAARDGSEVTVQVAPFAHEDEGLRVPVKIESAAYGTIKLEKAFQVAHRGSIRAVQPLGGPCAGGTMVTVTGTHLSSGKEEPGELTASIAGTPATVVQASPSEVLLLAAPCNAGATRGAVELFSPRTGKVAAPYSSEFEYAALPVVNGLSPARAGVEGGVNVMLRGDRLCHGSCHDLQSVRLGAALISDFKFKSPHRIVFTAPSAQAAGGPGEKTVVVHSSRFGRTVVPQGFLIETAVGAVVSPSNVPLRGGATVVVQSPGLSVAGEASSFAVSLAGVPARVVSVGVDRLVLTAGDATAAAASTASGSVVGSVIVTVSVRGKSFSKDLGVSFRYNPACTVDAVAVRPGAHGGQLAVLIAGSNLGFGDERVTVDGALATIHRREHRGSDVFRHHATVPHMSADVSTVQVDSPRSGHCEWHKPEPELQAERLSKDKFVQR